MKMSKATRHSAIFIAAYGVTSVLNYIFGVVLSWLFSPAEFGVLGVAQSLLLLTGLIVGAGFAWTAAHDMASFGVTDETRRYFRVALVANTVLGLLIAFGLWFAYAMGWLPLGPVYRMVIPLIGLTTVVLSIRAVGNGAARGLYRFGPVAVNLIGEAVIKVVCGLGLVVLGGGVAGVMVGFALGAMAALVHNVWILQPARLWQGKDWFDKRVLVSTGPFFIGMLGSALILNLDVLGLKLLTPGSHGDELAGLYQAAVILARVPVFIAQPLTLVLFSYVASANGFGKDESKVVYGYAQSALKVWFRLLLPAGLVLILAPRTMLALFFPPHYQASGPALQVAAGGGAMLALATLLTGVFQAAGDRRRPAIANGLAAVIQMVVLVWLVPHWGVLGAALSLAIASFTALLGLVPSLVSRFGPSLSALTNKREIGIAFYRAVLPLLALVVPLLALPDGGRWAALLKLGLAGLSYLVVLMGTRLQTFGWSDRPATLGSQAKVAYLFTQFMNVLMGG